MHKKASMRNPGEISKIIYAAAGTAEAAKRYGVETLYSAITGGVLARACNSGGIADSPSIR
jgi:hypothetical protein